VERVARADHSTLGRTGTHILLWALPWDSAVHGLNWESRGGAHHVAPEAVSEIKAQAEAKFHMYFFVLR
jgi:hypothetical protein